MEALKLSEEDQQCYGKLFSCCDPENAGCVSWNKASELFLASLLPFETLSKVSNCCLQPRQILLQKVSKLFRNYEICKYEVHVPW